MKKYILPIFLSAVMMLPLGVSAQSRNSNYHRGGKTTEKTTGNARPGGNSRPGNNFSGNNRPGNNKDDKRGHDKGHGNHNNGYNHNNGNHNGNNHGNWNGNSNNRPGGSHNNPPMKPATPPHHPGGHPGHQSPAWGPGSSVHAPGHSYRPHHHHPQLGYMVNHAIRGGRYDNVWMVGPGQYAVRFYRNGCYYMQYIWPETGRYGNPFRIIMAGPGEWYAYNNRNQWYYDDGATLRISLNGSPLNPWTLVPSVELNINL